MVLPLYVELTDQLMCKRPCKVALGQLPLLCQCCQQGVLWLVSEMSILMTPMIVSLSINMMWMLVMKNLMENNSQLSVPGAGK